ncbi:restriction endonuclease [Aliivibrio fischeri]|nr:restriction endonuclease [Aliivibrio fischeri]MUK34616.1 restriction endonuclease [Aliivibrio fischeri]
MVELDPLTLDSNKVSKSPKHPFYGQSTAENGVISYIHLRDDLLNNKLGKPTILIHSNNQNIVYLERPFYLKDGHGATSVLQTFKLNKLNAQFIMASIARVISRKFAYNNKATKIALKNTTISLPIGDDGEIDFDFMERFIAELEADRIVELKAYLSVTGLENYQLTDEEQILLDEFDSGNITWGEFNIEALFGNSTRGKRLKSADRIEGGLPFVTAGETEEGVSAFIGNSVTIFPENTTTIDMFGSAKYRHYKYGGDDHVAVVHTEKLSKHAAIFVTASIHKSSYTGKFNYGRNFYAKDADELNILLPQKSDKPDYSVMATLMSAIHKLVIKDVVEYVEQKTSISKPV